MSETEKVSKLYLSSVLLFMLILPIVFILKDAKISTVTDDNNLTEVTGKWFLFWGIGLRLFTAGIRQVTKPSFTAQEIFHINDVSVNPIVKELGFANICLSLIAIISLFIPSWRPAAAFAGGLYFGQAGIFHIIKKPVTSNEKIAMISDIFIAVVMAVYLLNS